jgi:hypothetical protein
MMHDEWSEIVDRLQSYVTVKSTQINTSTRMHDGFCRLKLSPGPDPLLSLLHLD